MTSIAKAIVEDFLRRNNIAPNPKGALYADLTEDNEYGLEYLAFAITNYSAIPLVGDNIKAFAELGVSDFDKERQYNNRLTEFLGLWFVADVLKEKVVALEGISPHRPHGSKKTCDVQSIAGGEEKFYEVKDFSSEILTQVDVGEGITVFNPGLPNKIKPWIEKYVQNCVEKGANYLICRVPAWHVRMRPKLTAKWVQRIYPAFNAISGHGFEVVHGLSLPETFRGVYVVRRDEYLFMKF